MFLMVLPYSETFFCPVYSLLKYSQILKHLHDIALKYLTANFLSPYRTLLEIQSTHSIQILINWIISSIYQNSILFLDSHYSSVIVIIKFFFLPANAILPYGWNTLYRISLSIISPPISFLFQFEAVFNQF